MEYDITLLHVQNIYASSKRMMPVSVNPRDENVNASFFWS